MNMKKSIIYIVMLIAGLGTVGALNAQSGLQMRLGYNPAMPVGSFKDFMGKNSFRGYQGEISYPLSANLRIGLGVSFNDFYEKHPRQLYNTKDGVVSAVVSNSIQSTPILIKANYEFTKAQAIRPYVGLGAGFNLINYNQYFGEFNDGKSAFKPAFAADAGVNIPFNKLTRSAGINLGANFNYQPFKYNELKNLNSWGVHAGVYFPLR